MYLDKETLCHAVYTKGKLPSAVMQFIRTSKKHATILMINIG